MVEENEARGMDAEAARADALRRFGDMRRIRDACEEEDAMAERKRERFGGLRGLWSDVRYGVRSLARSPVYASVIVVTLAFGIGANASVFSALSPYFLRALPFDAPDRLVHLFTVDAADGQGMQRFSLPQFEDVRERARGFRDLATYYYGTANLSGDEAAEQVQVGRLSANAFDVLGTRPLQGRTFVAGEDGPGGADVLVLSWGLWQRRYAGDPGVIGRMVRMNGVPHVVIGVMPEDFNFPFGGVKAWAPLREDAATEGRDRTQFLVFGRLADGWTAERARADVNAVWSRLAAEHPDEDGRMGGIDVMGMRPALNFAWDILRIAFLALMGAVTFVLLIACANITGLGLARATTRRREVAVRAALGASRRRLVRQFLAESMVLALLGGGAGLLLAWLLMRAAGPAFPEDLYAVGRFGIDPAAALFTAAVTIVVALLIGTLPALSVTGARPGDALRAGGRSGTSDRRSSRIRAVLVVAELALGLVLVVGAGLMVRSLSRVNAVPLGFDAAGVLTVELTVPANQYPDASSYGAFYDRIVDRVRALPGVSDAATAAQLPLNHETYGVAFNVPGRPLTGDRPPSGEWFRVAPGYFRAMRVRLVEGRGFAGGDVAGSEPVAVINRALEARYFEGRPALGQTLLVGDSMRPVRIVGVVEDVRHSSITKAPPSQLYQPLAQTLGRRRFLVVRAAGGDAAALAGPVRSAITSLDADVPATRQRPMTAILQESVGPFAAMSIVLGVFGAFALLLAAIGLYGLIAYSVSQRQAEFGIRMALGAGPGEVVRSVVRGGIRIAAVGIGSGIVAALAAGRVLASLLFGTGAADPLTMTVAALLFLLTAVLAAVVPAVRAGRSDPLRALRAE